LINRFVIVRAAVCVPYPDAVPFAVKVAEPIVLPPVNVNAALVPPAAMLTEAGETVTSEPPLVIARLIVAPVDGAG
jgi:hypothetical protein